MQYCNACGIPMVGVLSFSKDKKEKYCRCPDCYRESKRCSVSDSELIFSDILKKEYHKSHGR